MRPTVSGSQLNCAFCGPKGTSNQLPASGSAPPLVSTQRLSPLANQQQGTPLAPKQVPIGPQAIPRSILN